MEVGSVSKIPYYQEFWKICCHLKGTEGSQYHKELHAFWNCQVFKDKPSSSTPATVDSDADDLDSDLDDMAEALRAVTISQSKFVCSLNYKLECIECS